MSCVLGAGIARSVQRLAAGWTVRGSIPGGGTSPGAHPASYTMGTGSLSWGYSGRDVVFTIHPHLAPKLKKE
jgi:hypothetical protein